MANTKKTWNELFGPKPGDLTPQEWEQKTGNKLLSYSTNDGKLAMNMPMSYRTPAGVAEDKAKEEEAKKEKILQNKERSLIESAYGQIMDRSSGGNAGLYQGGQQGLSQGGFYGSMPALEAASMRLADAALGRELISGRQKGGQERGLLELRGSQEYGLQGLRGSQERELQELRGSQEIGKLSEVQKLERKSEIEREIRALQRERINVGASPNTEQNRNLYINLGNQINELQKQLR